MNQPVFPHVQSPPQNEHDGRSIDLASLLNIFMESRWLIASVTVCIGAIGLAYALLATPIYQANLLIQVEESQNSPASIFGGIASAFEMKSAATAEMEILRSRYVLSRAVHNAQLELHAVPKRFPVIGEWIARSNDTPSRPGLLGFGGYAWGNESISIDSISIPNDLLGETFELTVVGPGEYEVQLPKTNVTRKAQVGELVKLPSRSGISQLKVSRINGAPGVKFLIKKEEVLESITDLQRALTISEKGKQSGIIGLSLEGIDPELAALTLNEIGREYIKQNIDRKSEEAQKSLAFLDKQLPAMKKSLEDSEAQYNALRNQRGTVDLNEEAKSILQQSVLAQTRLVELRQQRANLLTRYQESNPVVKGVDDQISTLKSEISSVNNRIKSMPETEQQVLRLTRDIKVNTDLYTSLLNSTQQLRLIKASKVGSARVLDEAVVSRAQVKPERTVIVLSATLLGIILGLATALVRKTLFGGIEDPNDVERMLGISVSAAIPHSQQQDKTTILLRSNARKVSVLLQDDPTDLAIESLRSLRTSLQFATLNAKNKIVMITGPTPGVGKSFISVNFAGVLGAAGKKVLLIDGDLRKGYLQRYFGKERQCGLSEIIAGECLLDKALHADVLPNVDFISTGSLPPRPAELLEHANFAKLLSEVESRYDYVLIDTAPVLAVTDALIVAAHAGTTYVVVRGNVTAMGEIEETARRFTIGGNTIAGVVFNDLSQNLGRYSFGTKYGKYRHMQYKY